MEIAVWPFTEFFSTPRDRVGGFFQAKIKPGSFNDLEGKKTGLLRTGLLRFLTDTCNDKGRGWKVFPFFLFIEKNCIFFLLYCYDFSFSKRGGGLLFFFVCRLEHAMEGFPDGQCGQYGTTTFKPRPPTHPRRHQKRSKLGKKNPSETLRWRRFSFTDFVVVVVVVVVQRKTGKERHENRSHWVFL